MVNLQGSVDVLLWRTRKLLDESGSGQPPVSPIAGSRRRSQTSETTHDKKIAVVPDHDQSEGFAEEPLADEEDEEEGVIDSSNNNGRNLETTRESSEAAPNDLNSVSRKAYARLIAGSNYAEVGVLPEATTVVGSGHRVARQKNRTESGEGLWEAGDGGQSPYDTPSWTGDPLALPSHRLNDPTWGLKWSRGWNGSTADRGDVEEHSGTSAASPKNFMRFSDLLQSSFF